MSTEGTKKQITMAKIPTAESFLNNYKFKAGEHIGNSDFDTMAQFAVDFAKLHVQACKEEIADNVEMDFWPDYLSDDSSGTYTINRDSILNSYPEDKIQ